MYAEERRSALIDLVRTEGRLAVTVAAEHFHVTPETIRRDLEVLDRQGVLHRVHGGAVLAENLRLGDKELATRETVAAEQKDRIAVAALTQLPEPGRCIILDAGTTVARLAARLPADYTVVTNSLPVAASVSATHPGSLVELLGGRVRGVTQSVVGGMEHLAKIRAEVVFLGANGVSLGHGLSTPDFDEAAMKRQMVRSADRVVVLADSRKLGAETTRSFAALSDVDVLVTDSGITEQQRSRLLETGIEVITA
jgi:DeoR family fructose operon transcriptional repressor